MPLDLVVPDLLLPVEAPEAMRSVRLPALERWLARGVLSRAPQGNAEGLLAALHGLAAPAPVAAIALAGDAAPREGAWLRADPVHLRAGQDAVALHDASILDIAAEEAHALRDALQAHFREDGLEFLAPAPDRWYVRVPEGELPRTVPLAEALGRNVFGLLPRGAGRINWAGALTEVQMLFAAHEVNARREARGAPAINSVWFWGEGALPGPLASPYAAVFADAPFPRGLARLAGVRASPLPASLDGVEPPGAGDVLVQLEALAAPLARRDAAAWGEAARRLDADWFAVLPRAIARFGRVRLMLPTGRDTCVAELSGAARWRWFRVRRPLAGHG